MVPTKTTIRVRYNEVDKMGYVYHGNYATYYHVGRTELLRNIGISDKELEKQNIILPVVEMKAKFIKPVFYDDIITIRSSISEMPLSRIKFKHVIFNQNNEVVHEATTVLAFVDEKTRKARRIPEVVSSKLELYNNLIK